MSQEELNQCNSVYLLRKPKPIGVDIGASLHWLATISDYLDMESLILQQPNCDALLTTWADVSAKFHRYSYWDSSIRKGVLPPVGTADMFIGYLNDKVTGDELNAFLHKDDDLGLTLYCVLMWSGSVTTIAPPVGFELKEEKSLKTLKKKGVEKGVRSGTVWIEKVIHISQVLCHKLAGDFSFCLLLLFSKLQKGGKI